jgi:hypothetical protein
LTSSLSARRIAFFTDGFRDDRLFAEGSRDGSLEPFRQLRRRLIESGRVAHTTDIFDRQDETPDLIVFLDAPSRPVESVIPAHWHSRPRFAVLLESEVVKPQNWDPAVQDKFDRLLTWRPSAVDGMRFFELNLPNDLRSVSSRLQDPNRLCTLIAGNKRASHPLELYSERLRTIKWFERHHPTEFDLYGIGWDLLVVGGPRPVRAVNLAPRALRRGLAPNRPSYRGTVVVKREVLSRYWFTICFENARDIDGYITEKLFDCLLAGSIAGYLGAPDVSEHVPEACFIDRRAFASNEDLYVYLRSMPLAERQSMRSAGQEFILSPDAQPFTTDAWVDGMLAHL